MKKLTALILALAMVLALVSCGSTTTSSAQSTASAAASSAQTSEAAPAESTASAEETAEAGPIEINVGLLGTNKIVCPYDPTCGWGMSYCDGGQTALIYDRLFESSNDGEMKSRILESWEWEDDTTLVCQLKDGIYFSNGDQLLGDDILFSYETILNGFFPIKFMYAFINTEESTVSEDGLTLTLKMNSVTPAALPFLTVGILDKDYIESVGGENIDWYDPSQVVGSGPYAPVEYVESSYSVYELRDDYWGFNYGYEQNIDKLTVKIYNDSTSMMSDYSNGVIDLAWGVTNDDYTAAMNGEMANSDVGMVTNNFSSWLIMEVDDGPLADPAVREAICYAVDTDTLRQTVLGNLGVTATGALAVNMLGYTADFQYSYNPDQAKQILADAGYSDGDITITYAYKSDDTVQSNVAELVQAYLLAVGINVDLQAMDEATYSTEETVEGYSDIAYYFMSNGADDPGQFTGNWMSTGTNAVICRHGLYDDIINEANGTLDTDARIAAFYELQKMWYENYDLLPLFELGTGYIYNTDKFESCEIQTMTTNLLYVVAK